MKKYQPVQTLMSIASFPMLNSQQEVGDGVWSALFFIFMLEDYSCGLSLKEEIKNLRQNGLS